MLNPFHVPVPDEVIFEERWETGEWFRSGSVWSLGNGKVFYFRPGHETFGVFMEEVPLKIVENAVVWLGNKLNHIEPTQTISNNSKPSLNLIVYENRHEPVVVDNDHR